MISPLPPDINKIILDRAKTLGAHLAGIADISSLRNSPSYDTYKQVEWPEDTKTVIVFALLHKESEPYLDWWDERPGGTPGNRKLLNIANEMKMWLKSEFDINSRVLPYNVEKGGIFLKDASVLAGLGVIGRNNLLITSEFGPRVRLSALSLDVRLSPTEPLDFTSCDSCSMPCRKACIQKAFDEGVYNKARCQKQMKIDETKKYMVQKDENSVESVIKNCRACELACPVGRE